MKIIIPMAGHSRRFRKAGYKYPKQFIKVNGISMIERVCQMFDPKDEFIFVANKHQLINKEYRHILDKCVHKSTIVEIDSHELGPVYSALQAEEAINNVNEPIIISYCDFFMEWDYRKFLLKAHQYEGAVAVFKGFHPASYGTTFYAYLKANDKLEMEELREKQSFTDNRASEFASTGVYYLDSWNRYKKYAAELLEKKDKVASEYYCSLLYNYLIRDNLKVGLFEVDKFVCLGTPEDMEEYLFWSGYFSNDVNMIMRKEL
ncbi:NTP transferase domain-containing protein [bacterium]